MRPTAVQYAQALYELSSKENPKQIISNFFALLSRRGESKKAKAVLKELLRIEANASGKQRVTVITAREADKEMKAMLSKQAEELFPGKTVEISFEVDSSITAGARFQTDEARYDITLQSRLEALKRAITKHN